MIGLGSDKKCQICYLHVSNGTRRQMPQNYILSNSSSFWDYKEDFSRNAFGEIGSKSKGIFFIAKLFLQRASLQRSKFCSRLILPWDASAVPLPDCFVTEQQQQWGTLSKEKNDIIWEFFPNVGPPPLLGTPYHKKILVFILHFRT